jgi:ABC-type multidrug transport system fused ATPase/permease subunit
MPVDRTILRRAWAMLIPSERRATVLVFAISFFAAIAAAVMIGSIVPFLTVLSNPEAISRISYLQQAYDYFGFTDAYDFLLFVAGVSFVIILVSGLIQVAKNYALAHYSSMRVHSISSRVLANYLAQEYEFFLSRHSGELAKEIFSEAGMVVNNFFRPGLDLIASVFTVLAILTMLLAVNPVVTLAVFAILAGVFAATYLVSRHYVRYYAQRRAALDGDRFRVANEALGGVKDIKIVGREDAYQERFHAPSLAVAKVRVLSSIFTIIPQFAIQIVVYSGIILFCLMAVSRESYMTGDGLETVLPLVAVFGISAQRLLPEMQRAYASLIRLQMAAPAVDSVYRDITRKTKQRRRDPNRARIPLTETLGFDKVSYLYPGSETGGLREVSLDIRAGEKIGIVGSTGAGKTTLADVTLGLLRPGSGHLVVDGVPIDDAALPSWQMSVGYVPQDIFLTDASIIENIAFGNASGEIDRDRALACGRMAQLDEFVLATMPEGYDSRIGERGVRLSGGQRQRIGIARALYRDADLIVFDEATSALDNVTEREVISAIEALPGNNTIMMVAHRLSTVRICDRILVLDKGRVAGFDTWERLVETCPPFRRLAEPDGADMTQPKETAPNV